MTDRTEVVSGRFTPRERRMIEAEAKRQGIDVSNYVRASIMTMLVFDGNKEAIRITGELMQERFKRWVQDKSLQTMTEVAAT